MVKGWSMEVQIGIICTVIGVLIGIISFSRNRDKDVKNEATKEAVIETKLDHISKSVDSMRMDLKSVETKWSSTNDTVIRIDESVKNAHQKIEETNKRIDFLEDKVVINKEIR